MKKIYIFLLLVSSAFIFVGCPFHGSPEHRRAHRKAIHNDYVEIHKFIDRHFWNYDWDNPYHN